MNLPNKLTLLRVCMIPFFVIFARMDGFSAQAAYCLVPSRVSAAASAPTPSVSRIQRSVFLRLVFSICITRKQAMRPGGKLFRPGACA